MNKKYKIALGLGTVATIVAPIATMIACGDSSKDGNNQPSNSGTTKQSESQSQTAAHNTALATLKAAIEKAKQDGLTAINNATDNTGVDNALQHAKDAIDKLVTDASHANPAIAISETTTEVTAAKRELDDAANAKMFNITAPTIDGNSFIFNGDENTAGLTITYNGNLDSHLELQYSTDGGTTWETGSRLTLQNNQHILVRPVANNTHYVINGTTTPVNLIVTGLRSVVQVGSILDIKNFHFSGTNAAPTITYSGTIDSRLELQYSDWNKHFSAALPTPIFNMGFIYVTLVVKNAYASTYPPTSFVPVSLSVSGLPR